MLERALDDQTNGKNRGTQYGDYPLHLHALLCQYQDGRDDHNNVTKGICKDQF
jgi:hypothetical protein